MPLILPGNVASATADAGYDVDNSCRFNGSDSYMHWTDTGGSGSRVQFSISLWCKKCSNGVFNPLVLGYQDGNNFTNLQFNASDQLQFYNETGNQIKGNLITNRLFRDPSAWYHILAIFDSGNGTAGNRMRLYVNGTEETSFATDANPDQNEDSWFNYQDKKVHLGYDTGDLGWAGSALAFNGYIAQFMLVDGTVLTPSDVGEFDSDSPTIWKPIDISSTSVGTNGAFLDFADSDNLGDNEGIAGEDWTEVNLDATDSATDTQTNNFCTMTPLNVFQYNFTFSEGNLTLANTDNNWNGASGTIAINKGKWYFEAKYTGSSNLQHFFVGFTGIAAQNAADATRNSVAFYNNDGGEVVVSDVSNSASTTADYGTFAQNDIIGVALDYDNELISFYKDDAAIVTDFDFGAATYPSGLIDGKLLSPYVGHYASSDIALNFGNPPFTISSGNADDNGYGNFEYDVPSGYYALCTKNLAEYG